MIHSLAGGQLGALKFADFVKVQIISEPFTNDIFWYIACGTEKVGDTVIVPVGKNNLQVRAKVLRIDKHVSSQACPVPISRAKKVIRVIK